MSVDRFSDRSGAAAIVFKDRIWVIAGEEGLEWKSDVWSSVDGIDWKLETESAAFGGRYNHKVFEFRDRVWVVGGSDENFSKLNDIWSSADGVSWREEIIEDRQAHSAASLSYVFDGKLWLAFGSRGDLWSTQDGENWQLESKNYMYPDGANDVVECNGKLCLFTRDKVTGSNRIWSSSDGINWEVIELDTSDFTDNDEINALLYKDEIWAFTYSAIDETASLWTSKDGKNWSKKSGSIYFGSIDVLDAYLVVFDGQLFVVGGNREIRLDDSNEWSSSNDMKWVDSAPDGFYSDFKIASSGH